MFCSYGLTGQRLVMRKKTVGQFGSILCKHVSLVGYIAPLTALKCQWLRAPQLFNILYINQLSYWSFLVFIFSLILPRDIL